MTTVQKETKTLFREAVARASLAPSIHNTQPWHFLIQLDEHVPLDVIYELTSAAEQEDASLVQLVEPERKIIAAKLSREAEALQNADERYRAELRAWTATDPQRPDGVPVFAIPDTSPEPKLEPLARNFDVAGRGWLPSLRQSSLNHCLMVLGTAQSTRRAWLRAGEALQRILLEATRLGFVVSLASQVGEVPSTRERLRRQLGLEFNPLLLMRIGRAGPTPASKRRNLSEIISEVPD